MKSYTELVTHLYSQENLAKIEWAIGTALVGGPWKILVISGPSASGKSSMLHIVEEIFGRDGSPNDVVTQHDGLAKIYGNRVFAATNHPMITSSTDMIVTTPTSNRHSLLTYRRLMDEVKNEIDQISQACIERYLTLGAEYYEDMIRNNCFQENNK
jgi:ABC-type phosphate transport system ATPase subunit